MGSLDDLINIMYMEYEAARADDKGTGCRYFLVKPSGPHFVWRRTYTEIVELKALGGQVRAVGIDSEGLKFWRRIIRAPKGGHHTGNGLLDDHGVDACWRRCKKPVEDKDG